MLTLATLVPIARAQPQDRLAVRIDGRVTVMLPGSRNPRIETMTDEGPLDAMKRMTGLSLRFKPSAAQSAALEQLLEDQQNPSSPLFHNWLTPEEFGDRFGLTKNDLSRVTDWLLTQGFQVDSIAKSRTYVVFSATAGQVRDTFRTELHQFRGNDETHFANVSEIMIPADLEPLIYNVRGLHDFRIKSRVRLKPAYHTTAGINYLGPGDLATIYNINPLWQKGINGSGQKIAVVGQSAFYMSDVRAFRQKFGLPSNDPRPILVPGLPDPGITDDLDEANLDVTIAGESAPNATILYVYSEHVENAAEYAIDQNLAPVVSESYGACEKRFLSFPSDRDALHSLAQQANAQGITWIACTGDTGPASCESQLSDTAGLSGVNVELPAAFPEVTAVGGSGFNEGTGNYWSSTNGPNSGSAVSYVPEVAWNDTSVTGTLAASGGGASMFFARPAWQEGTGVPAANARFVPDLAFAASWKHDAYYIVLKGEAMTYGGTSAATPFFAGIVALLNQSVVTNGVQARPGLGNINSKLYQLAQTTSGVFHDITSGNTIIPCKTGTPDCTTGWYGFSAGPGYDLATGLGSLDVYNFVTSWTGSSSSTPGVESTTTSATAIPATITATSSTMVKATVKATSGSATPNGPVYFSVGQTALGNADLSGSGGTGIASLTVYGSQLAPGANTITAWYGGASEFLSSTGTATVSVSGSSSSGSVVVPSAQPSPVYRQAPDADGYQWFYTIRLAETSGAPTKLTGFSINGDDYTAQIAAFFGSVNLPANGTLSAAVREKNLTVPANVPFSFSGIDASGQNWTQQLTVPFFGDPTSAAISLASFPETVLRSAKSDPNCDANHPYFQQLGLQENNGYDVQLTKFVAGGNDFSDQIPNWFGSLRLAPFGTLRANICWQLDTMPTTLDYEVDGVDESGQTVIATLQVTFKPAAVNPGVFSVSKNALALGVDVSKSAAATLSIDLPSAEHWSVTTFPDNQKSSWLAVRPQSGTGPGQVNVTASAAALGSGVYTATLVLQSLNTSPQFINVPVTLTVGGAKDMSVSAVQNAASFKPVVSLAHLQR
jgi:hypothetical protein